MQALTLFMIVVVTTFAFLTSGDKWGHWAILPSGAPYVAELLGAAALLYVVIAGARSRFQFVRPAYWIVFGALIVTISCGVVINHVAAGPIFAGIRSYLRAIPWFLVPAVFAYTDRQVQAQLRLLLAISLIQIPLAIQQRIRSDWAITGDWTYGTLMLSPTLSIFLVCGICIVAGLFVRKRLTAWQSVALFLVLLFPTLINETKATLLMLPIGLLAAFFAAASPGQRVRQTLVAATWLALFAAIFFPVYEYTNSEKQYSVPLTEMLSDPDRLERYLWYKKEVGSTGGAGKVDSIVVPLAHLSSDPLHLMFGLGIGNVSDSALGRGFGGRYFKMFSPFIGTSFGRLVLELGVLGFALVLSLMWMIYRDSQIVARRSGSLVGALAGGWAGVTAVFVIGIVYTELVAMTSLSFLFWYFSGLVVSERMRLRTLPASKDDRVIPELLAPRPQARL